MYAVIKTGGKQYKIEEGQTLKVEKLDCEEGSGISFDEVLLIDGEEELEVGRPYIEDAKVKAEVLSHGKHKKVIVFKKKRRKRYRRKKGHRQPYTEIKINEISK